MKKEINAVLSVLCVVSLVWFSPAYAEEREPHKKKLVEKLIETKQKPKGVSVDKEISGPGYYGLSMQYDSLERTYFVYVPKKYDPHVAAPLVFVFHGGGGWGDGMRAITLNKFERIADDEGQIIVYPDGLMYTSPTTGRKERHWNDNRLTTGTEFPHVDRTDDAGFVRELVNTLGNILTVDKRRIYATGLSNGGMFSLRLACELSDIIAAVASVAGCAIPEKTYQCIPREPVSVMLIESVDDPMVPYKGGSLPNNRGDVVAVESVLDKWVRNNGCEPAAQVKLLPRLFRDGTTVTQYTYINGKQDTETVLYKLTGAGHTWPGGKDFKALNLIGKIRKNTDIQLGVTSKNIDATKAIMEFFSRHSKIKGSDLNNQ